MRKTLCLAAPGCGAARDHQKYLDLINVMALVHQYQRQIKSAQDIDGQPFQYIEVSPRGHCARGRHHAGSAGAEHR